MKITKELMVDAIVGREINSMELAQFLSKKGLVVTNNPGRRAMWVWSRSDLERLALSELQELYTDLRRQARL